MTGVEIDLEGLHKATAIYVDANLFLQVSKHGHALILNYCQNKIGLKHANLNLSKALGWIKNMGFYVIEDWH